MQHGIGRKHSAREPPRTPSHGRPPHRKGRAEVLTPVDRSRIFSGAMRPSVSSARWAIRSAADFAPLEQPAQTSSRATGKKPKDPAPSTQGMSPDFLLALVSDSVATKAGAIDQGQGGGHRGHGALRDPKSMTNERRPTRRVPRRPREPIRLRLKE